VKVIVTLSVLSPVSDPVRRLFTMPVIESTPYIVMLRTGETPLNAVSCTDCLSSISPPPRELSSIGSVVSASNANVAETPLTIPSHSVRALPEKSLQRFASVTP